MNHRVTNHPVRIFRSIALVWMIAATFMMFSCLQVFAATSVSIGGKTSVNAGESFTVTVTFSSDNLGRVDGQMTYDTSVLSYVSGGSSSGDNGYIELKDAGTGEDLTFKIKFKAKNAGNSALKVSTNGVYNLEEEYVDAPSASASVNVKGSAETTETTTEKTTEETSSSEVTEPEVESSEEYVTEAQADAGSGIPAPILFLAGIAALALAGVIIMLILIRRSARNR